MKKKYENVFKTNIFIPSFKKKLFIHIMYNYMENTFENFLLISIWQLYSVINFPIFFLQKYATLFNNLHLRRDKRYELLIHT